MIPQTGSDLMPGVTYETQPSYTYMMNLEDEKVVGNTQGRSAMEQAIHKILSTERYRTPIYSWNYGVEFDSLIGKPMSYCIPEIERRIKEALLQDDRISSVGDFEFSKTGKGTIKVTFKCETTEGNVETVKEVSI
jgi:phage baseplate assembly protein W